MAGCTRFRKSLFRPQPFYNGMFCRCPACQNRNPGAQKGKQREYQQKWRQNQPVGKEPEQSFHSPECHRSQENRQEQRQSCCAHSVQQAFPRQHSAQLLSCHPDRLKNGQFPTPGNNPCKYGVKKIQYPNQTDDEAQYSHSPCNLPGKTPYHHWLHRQYQRHST